MSYCNLAFLSMVIGHFSESVVILTPGDQFIDSFALLADKYHAWYYAGGEGAGKEVTSGGHPQLFRVMQEPRPGSARFCSFTAIFLLFFPPLPFLAKLTLPTGHCSKCSHKSSPPYHISIV